MRRPGQLIGGEVLGLVDQHGQADVLFGGADQRDPVRDVEAWASVTVARAALDVLAALPGR